MNPPAANAASGADVLQIQQPSLGNRAHAWVITCRWLCGLHLVAAALSLGASLLWFSAPRVLDGWHSTWAMLMVRLPLAAGTLITWGVLGTWLLREVLADLTTAPSPADTQASLPTDTSLPPGTRPFAWCLLVAWQVWVGLATWAIVVLGVGSSIPWAEIPRWLLPSLFALLIVLAIPRAIGGQLRPGKCSRNSAWDWGLLAGALGGQHALQWNTRPGCFSVASGLLALAVVCALVLLAWRERQLRQRSTGALDTMAGRYLRSLSLVCLTAGGLLGMATPASQLPTFSNAQLQTWSRRSPSLKRFKIAASSSAPIAIDQLTAMIERGSSIFAGEGCGHCHASPTKENSRTFRFLQERSSDAVFVAITHPEWIESGSMMPGYRWLYQDNPGKPTQRGLELIVYLEWLAQQNQFSATPPKQATQRP